MDNKQTKIRVAIKWANGERLTLDEFNLWAKMLQTPPVIDTPNHDQVAAAFSQVLATMEQYLKNNRG